MLEEGLDFLEIKLMWKKCPDVRESTWGAGGGV